MATLDLIEQAEADKDDAQLATDELASAAQAKTEADAQAAESAKALSEDLLENGPAVVIVDTPPPPVVTLYTAAPDDTYTATILRIAD